MPKQSDRDKALFEHLRYWEVKDDERVRQELKAAGYDPDALEVEGEEFVRGLLAEDDAQRRESLARRFKETERLADEADSQEFEAPEDLAKAITDILAAKTGEGSRQQPRAFWRNFDKASREDQIRILKDIRLLKALQRKDESGCEKPDAKTVQAADQARQVLAELSVSHPGEESIRDLACARGALVREGPMQGAESWMVKMGRHGLIRVRESIPEDTRKRYDIAHELGHFELHSEADQLGLCLDAELAAAYRSKNAEEIEAHAFANEFLLPEKL
ncbi:MAG: ImmA/IrrE family metallo-endopeptidase, partial [Elusimicrobiota bacterium]